MSGEWGGATSTPSSRMETDSVDMHVFKSNAAMNACGMSGYEGGYIDVLEPDGNR